MKPGEPIIHSAGLRKLYVSHHCYISGVTMLILTKQIKKNKRNDLLLFNTGKRRKRAFILALSFVLVMPNRGLS